MSFSDPIADMLTRMRNAQARSKKTVLVPASRLKTNILQVLEREGYIKGYTTTPGKALGSHVLEVELKYARSQPVIRCLKRVSKPSLRRYISIDKLLPTANGFGNTILSTSKGVLSDGEARRLGVGGEVLFQIF